MTWFLDKNHDKFFKHFRAEYRKSDDYISDLFMESYEALWSNVQSNILTENKLSSSLYQYMLGIATNMLKASDRKTRELYRVNMFWTAEDGENEILNKHVQAKIQNEAELAQDEDEIAEMRDFIDQAVNDMKPPCNKLLRNFYWNRMSGEEIAEEMSYSSADSVKTQKNKCMKKLTQLVIMFKGL